MYNTKRHTFFRKGDSMPKLHMSVVQREVSEHRRVHRVRKIGGDQGHLTCNACEGQGGEEFFDDDWFDPISGLEVQGSLEFKWKPCVNCGGKGHLTASEFAARMNEFPEYRTLSILSMLLPMRN